MPDCYELSIELERQWPTIYDPFLANKVLYQLSRGFLSLL